MRSTDAGTAPWMGIPAPECMPLARRAGHEERGAAPWEARPGIEMTMTDEIATTKGTRPWVRAGV